MSEWWTYSPSDFLLFSPRVYYRLFELHNRALWPAQVLTIALGLVILYLLLRPKRHGDRFVYAILGGLWVWVAWAFFWERYATINWASVYVAPFFAGQGLALLWVGAVRGHLTFAPTRKTPELIGVALFAFSLVVYPALASVMGRPWLAAEFFGIAPDPTAAATLAVLAVAHHRPVWLLIIPTLWCAISGTILWIMQAGDFFVAPAGALAALALLRARRS
jgi:GNAT superfamily N-acetyltransferase